MDRAITQKEELWQYILRHGSITRAESANLHIYELSNRISEIELDKGIVFNRKRLSGQAPGGRKWRCVRYGIDLPEMQPGQTFGRCMPDPKQKASIG